jgi:hypothetical protein
MSAGDPTIADRDGGGPRSASVEGLYGSWWIRPALGLGRYC